jgi:predicted AAA+ superfamily ATPase
MERKAFANLLAWRLDEHRKPLVLNGARQVGKTWLLKEFGKRAYQNIAYINFESNERLTTLFSSNLAPERLLTGLRVETGQPIEPEKTLIVFDEVQENPKALTSLKYFYENAPQYHLVAAGSLLGISPHADNSFPVGKVDFLNLYPLSFLEFLKAIGEPELADLVSSSDWPMIDAFKEKLTESLRYYYCVGGMPESVTTFVVTKDLGQVRTFQKKLLEAYERDFSKYAKSDMVPRIRAVWNSLPAQLAREQKKFMYGLVREGARAREYESAIEWLCDAGLSRKIFRVSKPGLPLKAYQQLNAFKLYMLDTGLLAAHAGLPTQAVLQGNALFEEFKGALTEQYVAQELRLMEEMSTSYWSSDASRAEVDFLIQAQSSIFPLEVKAAENLQAKSLRVYYEKYTPSRAFRTSLSSYREESWLTNIPLYALSQLDRMT